ncbi:MAG: alpha/beta fold hydrolase [Bacteroidota bacterium]
MNNLSLNYLVRQPKTNIENPPLLVMLHGYGSNEQDLFSFADELPGDFLIISARAPLSLGFESYAWYTIHFDKGPTKFNDIPQAKESLKLIGDFLEEIKNNYQVSSDKIFLFGFSQGTILSIAYALNNPDKVKHVIALSGYVNGELLHDNINQNDYNDLDFYVSHGAADQVIPVDWARKTPGFLDALKIKNSYQEYPVGHGVAPQNFYDLLKWIKERL